MVTLASGATSDRGRVRSRNEDDFLAEWPIYLVADGMGGHSRGAEASRTAVTEFRSLAGRADAALADVTACVQRVQGSLLQRAADDNDEDIVATTLVGVLLTRVDDLPYWLVFNVGDSRAYLRENGAVCQLTVDHSLVQELIDQGRLSAAEARRHPQRHVVTRALGGSGEADVDYWLVPATAGQRILLCSDGLTSEIEDTQLTSELLLEREPQAIADRLVAASNAAGGRDNVTIVVIDVTEDAPGPEASEDLTQPRSRAGLVP